MNRRSSNPDGILIVSFQYWPALSARSFRWTALAERWVSEGREVQVVCARSPDRPAFEAVRGVHVHRVGPAWMESLRGAARPAGGGAESDRSVIRRTAAAAARTIWHAVYWPDTSCTWYFAARAKARELIAAGAPQALVTVSPTFTAVAVGRSIARALGLEVEVDLTVYHENGEQESKLLFVGPTPQAIHEAQRRCMLEDVAAILGRQFDKEQVAEMNALVNDLFDRDWKEKATQEKKPERAFETYTKPSRKNLH